MTASRPRVQGDREAEIYDAVIALLLETGYDRLTLDAVAAAVHVSKATLYRKWTDKSELVVEAVVSRMPDADDLDTGSLRSDLLGLACEDGGLTSVLPGLVMALMPALQRDPQLFEVLRARFLEPKRERTLALFRRAQARGEIGADADLPRLAEILPAMAIHECVVLGRLLTRQGAVAILDDVVLPACRATLA
ncbi:MAG: TetR/AcrR family transcriptional regulator [Actinomycetota bacterium]|nr:TetR/AcrR family transcriptional regulator [Actinomycetota bacterium]